MVKTVLDIDIEHQSFIDRNDNVSSRLDWYRATDNDKNNCKQFLNEKLYHIVYDKQINYCNDVFCGYHKDSISKL